MFAGTVAEGTTLAGMLSALEAPWTALVVMDADVATDDNVTWLRDSGYRYLVVNRERRRRFDPDLAEAIETRSGQKVHLHSVIDEETGEKRLYCYSEERAHKEEGIASRFRAFRERPCQAPRWTVASAHPQGARPCLAGHGRISDRSRGIAQHYKVDATADPETGKTTAVTWEKKTVAGTVLTHPGVYCLRTNVIDWDPESLWRTYTMLTDLDSVFRSLKSELGLRPIHRQTQLRSDGHLFITVLACQLVQTIRRRLREHGETASWTTLRRILADQQRVTATLRRKDRRTLHVRKATLAEPAQLQIYTALGLVPPPDKNTRMLV